MSVVVCFGNENNRNKLARLPLSINTTRKLDNIPSSPSLDTLDEVFEGNSQQIGVDVWRSIDRTTCKESERDYDCTFESFQYVSNPTTFNFEGY